MENEKKDFQFEIMELWEALEQLLDVVQKEFDELKKELENES